MSGDLSFAAQVRAFLESRKDKERLGPAQLRFLANPEADAEAVPTPIFDLRLEEGHWELHIEGIVLDDSGDVLLPYEVVPGDDHDPEEHPARVLLDDDTPRG